MALEITIKYGSHGLPVRLQETPGLVGILGPREPPVLAQPAVAVAAALDAPIAAPPLAQVARGRTSACVVISDSTRPVPNHLLLPPILGSIEAAGVPRENILLLIATGMHRPSTAAERERLVGPEIVRTYQILDHLSRVRDDMVEVGKLHGSVPALVNRHYVHADLKILTGFIEPHMWAGYSGGRKSILPGISALETLQYMHGPEMVAHPHTVYGRLDGNPFHEAGLQVLAMAGADFVVNVTLDTDKRVTGVFAGHPVTAHRTGCDFLAQHCVVELDAHLDFIVTSNAGAPLDCNLYQTVKGITGAAPVVKPGGDILIASQCPEGAGSPEYRELLERVDTPTMFLERLLAKEFFVPDQWCAQETYQVLKDHPVWLYTHGLSATEVKRFHFRPVEDVALAIQHLLVKHGPQARWAIVPDGPLVILRLRPAT